MSGEQLLQRLLEVNLLDSNQLQEIRSQVSSIPSAEDVQQYCLRQNWLTNWQLDRVLKDYRQGYYYGKYKVLYMCGAGTFARVYRCSSPDAGDNVALKLLRSRHSDNEQIIAQFMREGEIGQKLRHPNVVNVYDVVSERDAHWFAMEFVEGNTLREFLKIRKKLEPLEATRIMIDVLSGLTYAHKLGYSHRDIKLTNVLVSSLGTAKIADFGLAARQPGEVVRTVDYAGLEKATGAPKDDPRSDIFFLGCMLYHITTGTAPLTETKDRIARGAPSRFLNVAPPHQAPGVPDPLLQILVRSMALNPTQRYQRPAEMLMELRRAAERLGNRETSIRVGSDTVEASHSVMVVESNVEMQNALREGLKRSGFRVLVTIDPERALARLEENPKLVDCMIFSTPEIGRPALDAFNRLAEQDFSRNMRAILMLGEAHRKWEKAAQASEIRKILHMPLKLKELRAALASLIEQDVPEAEASEA